MTRTILISALTAACVATFCTLVCVGIAAPTPAQAAPDVQQPVPPRTVRIALVNLEEVSRATPLFRKLKLEWANAQAEVGKHINELEAEARGVRRQLEWPGRTEEDKLALRVQLQAIEETLEPARQEYERYLEALLGDFQAQVLKDVMLNLKRFTRQNSYDLTLQEYSADSTNDDFFAGVDFAQALMSKPVLDAPGALDGGSAFVTDITEELSAAMRKGGVPEDD